MTGWQYVDFFGSPILVFRDQDAYLRSEYGPNYMIPKGDNTLPTCFRTIQSYLRRSDYFDTYKYIHPFGMAISEKEICTASTAECRSTYFGRAQQLRRIMAIVDSVARAERLLYSLACDSLKYKVSQRDFPPKYAAFAVFEGEKQRWLDALAHKLVFSTLVLEHHRDGSVVHIRYSSASSTRLVIFAVPDTMTMNLGNVTYSEELTLQMHTNGKYVTEKLYSLCSTCAQCEDYERKPTAAGTLMNKNSAKCLSLSGQTPQLSNCDSGV